MGDAADAVILCGRVAPAFQIAHVVGPCELVLLNRTGPTVGFAVQGDRENLKPLVSVFGVSAHHVGVFAPAGPAPRSPKSTRTPCLGGRSTCAPRRKGRSSRCQGPCPRSVFSVFGASLGLLGHVDGPGLVGSVVLAFDLAIERIACMRPFQCGQGGIEKLLVFFRIKPFRAFNAAKLPA